MTRNDDGEMERRRKKTRLISVCVSQQTSLALLVLLIQYIQTRNSIGRDSTRKKTTTTKRRNENDNAFDSVHPYKAFVYISGKWNM